MNRNLNDFPLILFIHYLARLDAMLETSLLDTTIVGEISEIIREPLLMGDLNDNVNECRDNWPWKCNGDYFSSMRYSQ